MKPNYTKILFRDSKEIRSELVAKYSHLEPELIDSVISMFGYDTATVSHFEKYLNSPEVLYMVSDSRTYAQVKLGNSIRRFKDIGKESLTKLKNHVLRYFRIGK